MTEQETREEYITPKIREDGWNVKLNPEVKIEYEWPITPGKIKSTGGNSKGLRADYVLRYKGRMLAVIEAKSMDLDVSEGVAQAKDYADKLGLEHAYSANGKEIYYMDLDAANEDFTDHFMHPDKLWDKCFPVKNDWQNKFCTIPTETKGGVMNGRFYQELAINKALDAIANNQNRILLTLATGTGKTYIAFQVVWKLFQTRWNLSVDKVNRQPRVLFLADRNILADQAYTSFFGFPDGALVRINPKGLRKLGSVPTNGSVFFTIFQTFMSGTDKKGNPLPSFGEYPKDFFDLVIIDECHRGGANDESSWRSILDYFSPAVQIGLTATPRHKDNIDTYKYFKEPVYTYSLKEGINDGFLTPFKVKKITTDLDTYKYESDDYIIEGDIDKEKEYTEDDFNKTIEIKEREEKRVKILLSLINQSEKTLVFCATQAHAAMVRDFINKHSQSKNPMYCCRVTANDGEIGEQHLRDFQDNEKSIPTILTTSRKLSTGVDARNIRNIVLLRPVKDMVEFKQIIGRGTRLFEGKNYFTIYDFVNACEKFKDPAWDGEAEPCPVCGKVICECQATPPKPCKKCGKTPCICEKQPPKPCKNCGQSPCICKKKVKIKLANGKESEIEYDIETSFFGADGQPLTAQEFMDSLLGKLPELFKNEKQLRDIWSNPLTRKELLEQITDAGFSKDDLETLQKLINAEKSDLFDVLEYIFYSVKPLTREDRVAKAQPKICSLLNPNQKEFIDFILQRYITTGIDELDQDKLGNLLELKYHDVSDNVLNKLGGIPKIRAIFLDLQKELFKVKVA